VVDPDVIVRLGQVEVECSRPSYVVDEEMAVYHYSRYMELTKNEDPDYYSLPKEFPYEKAFVSLTPTDYNCKGVRLGVDLCKLYVPTHLKKIYQAFGCGPGVTFLMDPRYRNTTMRYLCWLGLLDVRHLGIAPKIEVTRIIDDCEIVIDMSLQRSFYILSKNRGDPLLAEHLGLKDEVEQFTEFSRKQVNKKKPTKVLSH
jgi:hypothetical protein